MNERGLRREQLVLCPNLHDLPAKDIPRGGSRECLALHDVTTSLGLAALPEDVMSAGFSAESVEVREDKLANRPMMQTAAGERCIPHRVQISLTELNDPTGPMDQKVKELVSPRQVAQAIGVSESSLKRWCDKGIIPTVYTAGGHRRIPVNGVLAFLRESGMHIENPEILGLPPATTGGGDRKISEERERFLNALILGEEEVCVEVILNLYLADCPLHSICDEVLTSAFETIGEKWDCGEVAVYQERRSCELCHRVMHEMRRCLPELQPNALIAAGGTLDGDPYTLASSMAELVLRDLGWRANSLGNMLPFSSLTRAMCDICPKLFWVSVSAIRDLPRFLVEFEQLSNVALSNDIALVVGGQGLTESVRKQMRYSAYCDNFQHLATVAQEVAKRYEK